MKIIYLIIGGIIVIGGGWYIMVYFFDAKQMTIVPNQNNYKQTQGYKIPEINCSKYGTITETILREVEKRGKVGITSREDLEIMHCYAQQQLKSPEAQQYLNINNYNKNQ